MKKYLILIVAVVSMAACKKNSDDVVQPNAKFSCYIQSPLTLVINDASTGTSVMYDFGDGSDVVTTRPNKSIAHKYKDPGNYTINAVAVSQGKQAVLHKKVIIPKPAIYIRGTQFIRIYDQDEYFRFKVEDDGYVPQTIVNSGWAKNILYDAILPVTSNLPTPVLLDPTNHSYFTLYIYHSETNSGNGTQRLKKNILVSELSSYPNYIEKHNDADNTVVRLLFEYR